MDAGIAVVIDRLARANPSPGVSITVETTPQGSEADPIRLKDALINARRRITEFGADPVPILGNVAELGTETGFWSQRTEGLAVYASDGVSEVVDLDYTPSPIVRVERFFRLTPLLRMLPRSDHLVVALSDGKTRVFRVDRRSGEEVTLEGMPQSLDDLTRFADGERSLQSHAAATVGGGKTVAAFHGQGGEPRSLDDMRVQYLRLVDRALSGSELPVILAGVDELVAEFRRLSEYPRLTTSHISGNFDRATPAEIRARARPIMEPARSPRMDRDLVDLDERRRPVAESQADVAEAAVAGRVEVLFISPDTDADAVVTEVWRHGGRIWVGSESGGSMTALLRY